MYLMYQNQSDAYKDECALRGIASGDCSLLEKLESDFMSVKLFWLGVIIVAFMISNILRALRWHQLLEPMGFKPRFVNSLGAVMIGYFANLGLPRIGEFVRAATIRRYEDIPMSKAMGTIVIDRLLDILALLCIIILAGILSFTTFRDYFADNFKSPGKVTIYLGVTVILLGIFAAYYINRILKYPDKLTSPLFIRFANLWNGFKEGVKSIGKLKNVPLAIAYTVGIWLMYYLMTYLCFFSFAPTAHLGPVAGLVVFVFGTLGIVFPSPGGMGSYHFLVSQALVIYGVSSIEAFAFSNIVFFSIQILGVVLFGLLFLIVLPVINKGEDAG